MRYSTVISFVRHGCVDNPQGIYYGRLPGFALSEEGKRRARLAAEALQNRPIAAIYSSPLLRARQTAGVILMFHKNLTLRTSRLLNEIYSPFDGSPIIEIINRRWDLYTGVESKYEQPSDVVERVNRFVARILKQHEGQHVVAVTHGDLIAFMILWVKRLPVTAENRQALCRVGLPEDYPAYASVSTFTYEPTTNAEMPSFEYLNPELNHR